MRAAYGIIAPKLPIGVEGEAIFDLGPFVELVRNGELLKVAFAELH